RPILVVLYCSRCHSTHPAVAPCSCAFSFFLPPPPPPRSTLFPYTTLFRSRPPLVLPHCRERYFLSKVPIEQSFAGVLRPCARNEDRKSTRLNSSHGSISYAVFCLKKTTTK